MEALCRTDTGVETMVKAPMRGTTVIEDSTVAHGEDGLCGSSEDVKTRL